MNAANKRPRFQLALAAGLLLAALLGCRKSSTACTARLTYQGSSSVGSGKDRLQARHKACRAWCTAKFPTAKRDSDEIAECATRCGGDVLFGKAVSPVTCN